MYSGVFLFISLYILIPSIIFTCLRMEKTLDKGARAFFGLMHIFLLCFALLNTSDLNFRENVVHPRMCVCVNQYGTWYDKAIFYTCVSTSVILLIAPTIFNDKKDN